jgi:hypothetical protein
MKLPNGEQAEIAMEKLINYCLNPEHSSGKNKARVFKSRLGIRFFGLSYAMDWGYKGWNPYIERYLAIFVNCF